MSVETLIQYLTLDKTYAEKPKFEGSKYVMSPPLRDKRNQHRGDVNSQLHAVRRADCRRFNQIHALRWSIHRHRTKRGGPLGFGRLERIGHFWGVPFGGFLYGRSGHGDEERV